MTTFSKISQKIFFSLFIFVITASVSLPICASEPANFNITVLNEDVYKTIASYLLYHEAAALSCVNKLLHDYVNNVFSHRNIIINEFNKQYPDNTTIFVEHKVQEGKDSNVLISAKSLMFDTLGNHVRGYSLEKRPSGYDMGEHYCKRVTLSYPTLEIQKIEDIEPLSDHGYVDAITNKNRTVSLLISREWEEWKWEHRTICGVADTWDNTARPIQLQGTALRDGTRYALRSFYNLIVATFICKFYDKSPDAFAHECESYEEAHTYAIGNEKGSLFIAERNDLMDGEFVLIQSSKPLSHLPFKKRPTSKTKKAYWSCCNLI